MTQPRSKITRLKFRDPSKLLRVAALEIQAIAEENKALVEKSDALAQNNNRLQQTESRSLERQEATRSKLRHQKQGIQMLERQRDSHILKCAELERQNLQLRKENEQLVNKQRDLQDRESQIDASLSEQEQLRNANREQQISIQELQSKVADLEVYSAKATSVEATVKQLLNQTGIVSHPRPANAQRVDNEPVDLSWEAYDPNAFLNLSPMVGSSDNMFTFK